MTISLSQECIALCLNSDEFEIPISCRSANFYPDDEVSSRNGNLIWKFNTTLKKKEEK